MTRIELLRAVVRDHQAQRVRIDGQKVYIDALTAGAAVAIHDALSPANQEKYLAMPWQHFVDVTWKLYTQHGRVAS